MKRSRFELWPRSSMAWVRVGFLLGAPLVLAGVFTYAVVAMPGESHRGLPGPLSARADALPDLLRTHVETLAGQIGPRHEGRPETLAAAARFITARFAAAGLEPTLEPFAGRMGPVANVVAEVRGGPARQEIVVVGAHYDTVEDSPGADDNASGVAVLLELASAFSQRPPRRTVRFIAFVNEEPPSYRTETMGSLVAARASLAGKERVVAMFSLEAVGYFRDEPGTQDYPAPLDRFYPDRGDFIAFVGNMASRPLLQAALATFRTSAQLPSEGTAAPGLIPGIGWSDHWSYWQMGYPAVMITDTAVFRNPAYHLGADRPETLDYARMAWVTLGMAAVVESVANE